MASEFLSVPLAGNELVRIQPEHLTLEKSRKIAEALLSGAMNWVKLLECYAHRSADEVLAETVVFETDVELPQRLKFPIAACERVAVTFEKEDRKFPKVYALREEFPPVSHINLEPFELPRSLCLFDLPYEEVKLRWNPISFIERVRTWLADTASGELHKSDQPLEPLLFNPDAFIIFPPNFFSGLKENPVAKVRMVVDQWENGRFCFVADSYLQKDQTNLPRFLVVGLQGKEQQHGPVRNRPTTIAGLSEFLNAAGIDLLTDLQTLLSEAAHGAESPGVPTLGLGLIIVVSLPKTRDESGAAETIDTYAFVCVRPEDSENEIFLKVSEIGERIGLWQMHEGKPGRFLVRDANRGGDKVGVWMLAPCFPLSRDNAPVLSGTAPRIEKKLVAVGLGALGSQIFLNLVRTGVGEWTTIDKDILLPHNFIRHAAYGSAAGLSKSQFLSHVANATIEAPPISTAIVADILSGSSADAVDSALCNAAIIFDFSASQAVARHLALDVSTEARRVSVFLNPSGTDLVILAEDAGRATTLDSLEMQYYRLISSSEDLAGHLRIPDGQARFSSACRDVSNAILPDLVARGAAVASSAIREIVKTNEAVVAIWSGKDDGEIRKISAPAGKLASGNASGWTIRTDEIVMDKIRAWRNEKLPVETGGTLIGTYDMQRSIIYVADALPAPVDSIEKPVSFVRGSFGLKPMVETIRDSTLENLQYVGEWHSHPAGHSSSPSDLDRKLLARIAAEQHKDGNPGLMLICGDSGLSWHVA